MKYPEILSLQAHPAISIYTDRDTILYALGVGMGQEPADSRELRFVYEKGLRTLPTMSAILTVASGKFIVEGGLNFGLMLHGEERLRIHRPLPPQARIESRSRCLSVVDKGADKGALLNVECVIADAATHEPYSTVIRTLYCRGDGGFGGPGDGALLPHPMPVRHHDQELALKTRADQAAIYRLSGDRNPLHIDPETAARAGFARPILHGLCTYGIACRAVMQAYCELDPARIRSFDVRFSSPVYPGETVVTRMWKDASTVSFECSVAERLVTVIKNGRCDLSE